MSAQSTLLDNFMPQQSLDWRIINDGVMGGISSSRMERLPEGIGKFSGKVSLENNGGFASTRATLAKPLTSTYAKVVIKVKGDGKKYSFRIQPDNNFERVSYKQDFQTESDSWLIIELPLKDFIPTWRGRILPNQPQIEATKIQQIGFLISDKQEGSFELLVDWIKLE